MGIEVKASNLFLETAGQECLLDFFKEKIGINTNFMTYLAFWVLSEATLKGDVSR